VGAVQLQHILHTGNTHPMVGAGLDAKGVEGLKVDVVLD
jgi:hypothetical protein